MKRAVHHVLATLSITSVPEGSKYDGTIDQRLLKVCERDAADAAVSLICQDCQSLLTIKFGDLRSFI